MAVAVICELNPFHYGHAYLIEKTRALTGEPVVAVMSGSFTQRGEVAITDKFSRARSALQNGVDLVVELPAVYASANAERFARGGVNIAKSFSDVNYLAFGCETDDLKLLEQAAYALYDDRVGALLSQHMKNGDYYPKAMEKAVREVLDDCVADVLTSPNNVLAVEYIRALKGSKIKPLPIKRTGAEHDSGVTNGKFASASLIRERLRRGEDMSAFLPSEIGGITFPQNLERAMLYKLRTMTAQDFAQLPDVSEGLENRIIDAVRKHNTVDEILSAVKTKRYTHSRLRRILICALLGITEDLQKQNATYARVLGFSEAGAALLKSCSFKVITSAAKTIKADGENAEFLKKDILASDVMSLAFDAVKGCSSDFQTKMIKQNSAL